MTYFLDRNGFRVTNHQVDTLRFIHSFHQEFGFAPTWRDLMAAFGLTSSNAAHCRVVRLERHGYISRLPKRARSLTLTERGRQVLGVSFDPWPFRRVDKEEEHGD